MPRRSPEAKLPVETSLQILSNLSPRDLAMRFIAGPEEIRGFIGDNLTRLLPGEVDRHTFFVQVSGAPARDNHPHLQLQFLNHLNSTNLPDEADRRNILGYMIEFQRDAEVHSTIFRDHLNAEQLPNPENRTTILQKLQRFGNPAMKVLAGEQLA